MVWITRLILLISISVFSVQTYCLEMEKAPPALILKTGFFLDSFPDISQTDLAVALPFWVESIGKKVGIQSETYLYTNIEAMRMDYLQDKINFIVASPLTIAEHFDAAQLSEGYKIIWGGQKADSLLVITHKQSGLDHFSKLKNRRLSILANDRLSALYADILSKETFNLQAKSVFKKIITERKSSQLVLKLFFKNTDVILVYQGFYNLSSELNPQIANNTQVIAKLSDMPRALGFFHPRVDPIFRDQVLSEVERLNSYPAGQQLLDIFHADKAIRSKVDDLKSVISLKQRYKQLTFP